MEKLNDNATLEALRQGNRHVFDTVFRAYYEPLCHYAGSMTNGDMDEAEDIVQQTFLKMWEKKEELTILYSVKAYLYKMVHNRCLNHIRSEKTKSKYKQHNAIYLDNNHSYQHETERDVHENVLKAVESLPDQCRQVFELSRFEELKYREIADQMGLSIKTVENHMGKALRILRERLAEYIVSIMVYFLMF